MSWILLYGVNKFITDKIMHINPAWKFAFFWFLNSNPWNIQNPIEYSTIIQSNDLITWYVVSDPKAFGTLLYLNN